MGFLNSLITWIFQVIQPIIIKIFSPDPPPPRHHLPGPRIAIIGAGITGVSSAAHCVGHGFEVTLFEAGDEKHLGGIWSVSNLSTLHPPPM